MIEMAPFLHHADLERLMSSLAEGECCSVVSLSNMGKSTLLRQVGSPAAQQHFMRGDALGTRAGKLACLYVDCNLMLTPSEQGFYEAALRSALAEIKRLNASPTNVALPALVEQLQNLYHKIVEPSSPFLVPLSFNEAIMALCEQMDRRVVFLFDEFDDPFRRLDGRVFLNLRALRDKYGQQLSFVTATGAELGDVRQDDEALEFCELFGECVIHLAGLAPGEARSVIAALAASEGVELDSGEIDFVLLEAGGHLGLIQAVGNVLLRLAEDATHSVRKSILTMARQHLAGDTAVRSECAKLWDQLSAEDREALLRFLNSGGQAPLDEAMSALARKGILVARPLTGVSDSRSDDESHAVFSDVFAGYARRQRRAQQPARAGVMVDVDSGDVWIDAKKAPVLTDHEYRLLLLMYGRMNKIVTRDEVAEAVWGAEYMENIDDARCDKLVSRLRSKIEPDPANPKYLQTVRGRGYRLSSA